MEQIRELHRYRCQDEGLAALFEYGVCHAERRASNAIADHREKSGNDHAVPQAAAKVFIAVKRSQSVCHGYLLWVEPVELKELVLMVASLN
jgi:hypothetical protein